jgi:hypothetical protein
MANVGTESELVTLAQACKMMGVSKFIMECWIRNPDCDIPRPFSVVDGG